MADPSFDAERNILRLGTQRIVFHCHHYNVVLQRSIEEMLGDRGPQIQIDAAAESARCMLEGIYDGTDVGWAKRLSQAEHVFSSNGFGRADVSGLTADRGGVVSLATSHYAVGWRAKLGNAKRPVCYFATGFWRGALAAAASLAPERVHAHEERCHAVEGGSCEIRLEVH